jgi:hypothetical protein
MNADSATNPKQPAPALVPLPPYLLTGEEAVRIARAGLGG